MQTPSKQFFALFVSTSQLGICGEDQSESMVALTDLYDLHKYPANELGRRDPVHNYQQRVQNLSIEAQLIKLSTDAGFVKTVALGQFFMTRDAEEFSVGGRIGCREFSGFVKVQSGPVLEVNPNNHQGMPGIEISIESFPGDNSQSWVRISNGLNKFVRDLTEKSRILDEEVKGVSTNGATQFPRIENRTSFSKGN